MVVKLKKELELIHYVRHSILDLIAGLSPEQMNLVPGPMKNNLIWNLGHLVFTQQMLCYQLGGITPTIDIPFFSQFAPDTHPGAFIGAAEIENIKRTFSEAFEKLTADISLGKLDHYAAWNLPSGIAIENIEDAMATNAVHEGRHFGVIISLIKLVTNPTDYRTDKNTSKHVN